MRLVFSSDCLLAAQIHFKNLGGNTDRATVLIMLFSSTLTHVPPSAHLQTTSSTTERRAVVVHAWSPHPSSPKPVQPVSQSAVEIMRIIVIQVEVPESSGIWLQSWYHKHVVVGQIRHRGSRACMANVDVVRVVRVTAHMDTRSAAGSLLTAGMRAVLTS